ncbi:phosphatase PAP2 family protein [Lentilactobacillus kisonensis]|uniref:PAP2 family protein n=1 Tax=Lentilactobacillus kisonensis F0435 TaxID=797516 RepID=H1LFT3_9LACO|nr:phosphatase PAP2 family protein [Lentilactobacillus kisonensis]EHO51525.1 PAP2 family protein [Lentilactobacillus kisonensis F0435]
MNLSSLKHPYLIVGWLSFISLSALALFENIQLFAFDRQILNYFRRFVTTQRTEIFKAVALIASPAITILLSIALSLVLWHLRQVSEALIVLTMTITGNLAGFVTKLLIQRPRPTTTLIPASGYSFPSGHMVSATIFVFVVLVFGIRLIQSVRLQMFTAMLLIFWLGLVALSRVYLQVHYPSDVISGGLFSVLWCETILTAFRQQQLNLNHLIADKRGVNHEP